MMEVEDAQEKDQEAGKEAKKRLGRRDGGRRDGGTEEQKRIMFIIFNGQWLAYYNHITTESMYVTKPQVRCITMQMLVRLRLN